MTARYRLFVSRLKFPYTKDPFLPGDDVSPSGEQRPALLEAMVTRRRWEGRRGIVEVVREVSTFAS